MLDPQNYKDTRETNQSLWLLAISPTIWSVHFLASYITAAVWCAKLTGREYSLDPVRVAIAVFTVVALAGISITGWFGYRRHGFGSETEPRDLDSPEDRHRFLGFSTLLLSGLSFVATIMVAMTAIFLRTCH